MDYSSLPNDPDHPVGSSPWQSSPQPSRPIFNASETGSLPSSPLAKHSSYAAASPQGTEGEISDQDIHDRGENAQPISSGAVETPQPNGTNQASSNSMLSPPLMQQPPQFQPQQQSRQPQNQQSRGAPNRYHGGANRNVQRQNLPQYKLQTKVTSLERTGRKDPVLRFDVHVSLMQSLIDCRTLLTCFQTNLPEFRTTQFRDVRRTHSEFSKLADHLISSNPEALVPAVPPPLTAAGAGTDEDEARVKSSMQRWLNVVCSNAVLMRDDEMVFFVESDSGYSPVMRMKQPATGVRRRVIKQFAPPPDDTPELHEARPIVKLFYLGTMETGQKLDRVVKARRGEGIPVA